jgi:hypothetical protein
MSLVYFAGLMQGVNLLKQMKSQIPTSSTVVVMMEPQIILDTLLTQHTTIIQVSGLVMALLNNRYVMETN